MQSRSRRVPGAGGIDLHLLEWSDDGVPMLLLHGYGNEAHIWDDLAPSVAPHYRVLALDHRGHGDSAWDPEGSYDHDTMVRDVEAVTAALDIERLVLVGHSLGGRIATLFAGGHADRMAGVILVDVGPDLDARGVSRIRMDVASNQTPSFASVGDYARALTLAYPAARPEAIGRMARYGLRPREDGRFELKIDPALRGALGTGETPEEAALRERTQCEAQWASLARISCPTLVIRGAASDLLSPETADRMVEEVLPRGSLAVVPQAGHSVMTDNPEGFRDAVCGFVLAD